MQKVLFYCQHVLGMGHFIRSAALVAGLADRFQVCFLNGGEIVPGFEFPTNVQVVNLPPMKADETFKQLQTAAEEKLAEIQTRRVQQILATFAQVQPDLVIIELFPFGRKKFGFELLPLLAHIRLHAPQTRVVCSLRDILVSRPDQSKYEGQVCDLLNRYFDALLIHADPAFQRLEETFTNTHAIAIPIDYTGYVVQPGSPEDLVDAEAAGPAPAAEELPLPADRPLLLASIGGGRVGYELLAATTAASKLLQPTWPHHLLIFTGPYLPEEQFTQLQTLVADQPQITLRRYTTRFLTYMARAQLSLSMAGYNTCMNIVTTGTRALVLPFTGGQNDEQTIRAHKLAARGVVGVLEPAELAPDRLASKILTWLQQPPITSALNLRGVENTAARLTELATSKPGPARPTPDLLGAFRHPPGSGHWVEPLRATLEQQQQQGRTVNLFMRDDDIDVDEESLRHLLDIAFARNAPVSLAVMPGKLTPDGITLVKNYKKLCPELIEIHQHGWQHVNHESTGRKCEFGVSRSYAAQYEDIARGKACLEQAFEDKFFPAFTPPWNRCTADTLRALHELNFQVFSKDWNPEPLTGYNFREISITIDLLRWKGGVRMAPPEEIVGKLISQLAGNHPIGLLLHHKVMDGEVFAFLNQLLAELGRSPCVRFQTLQGLYENP